MIIGIDASALVKTEPTGVELYVQNLLRHMMTEPLQNGERVILYGPCPKPPDLELPIGWSWKELRFFLPRGWTHLRLSAELTLYPPDVFFCPAHEIPLMHLRTKIVTTVHDVVFRHAPRSYAPRSLRRQEWAIRRAARQAEAILAVSEATRRDLMSLYRVPEERITVSHLGLRVFNNQLPAADVLARHDLKDRRYILFVGRVEEKKNLQVLLKAFLAHKEGFGAGFPCILVFAGKEGYGSGTIRARAAASAFAKDIKFLNYVSDEELPALYANAAVFAFPSHGEGFGLPVIEAMSFGTPVVASDMPALREIADGAALFAAPDDVAAWTGSLASLLTDEELRRDLKVKGLMQAKNFTWPQTANLTWQVLRKVCATSSTSSAV